MCLVLLRLILLPSPPFEMYHEEEFDGRKGQFMIMFSMTFGCTSTLILHSRMMSLKEEQR